MKIFLPILLLISTIHAKDRATIYRRYYIKKLKTLKLKGKVVQNLKRELEKLIEIDDKTWKYIKSKFKPKSAKKGEIVHHTGDICSDVWYIKSGLARSYFIDNNGKDFTWQLYFNDESKSNINLFMDDSVSYYEN